MDKQTGTKGQTSYREIIRKEIINSNPNAVIDEQLIYWSSWIIQTSQKCETNEQGKNHFPFILF